MYGKDKRFFVLLDYPWDNGSYDPIHYINRLNPQKNKNNDIIVDLPEEKSWSKGNQYVEKVFSSYATIIETETKVCPNKIRFVPTKNATCATTKMTTTFVPRTLNKTPRGSTKCSTDIY